MAQSTTQAEADVDSFLSEAAVAPVLDLELVSDEPVAPLALAPPETDEEQSGDAATPLQAPELEHLVSPAAAVPTEMEEEDGDQSIDRSSLNMDKAMLTESSDGGAIDDDDVLTETESADPVADDVEAADQDDAPRPTLIGEDLSEAEASSASEAMLAVASGDETHATIEAVTESSDDHTDSNEPVDEVVARILATIPCQSAEVKEWGEILVLPKGWSTRQSKTHDGKTYYVSPYGHTRWLRPPLRSGVAYNWVHEIEVTFGYGLLGLNLKPIPGDPGSRFSDVQVHISEIYKLPNGLASPAEIYNWGVKPEKRIMVGMRMTAMNGVPLTGYTYSEVLDKLSRVPRPVRIKFADISKGIVGRVEEAPPQEETEEEKEARKAMIMQKSLRLEYFQILVAYELHLEVGGVLRSRLLDREKELHKKTTIVETHLKALEEYNVYLENEREAFIEETAQLKAMLEQLNLQELGVMESPEVAKTNDLTARNEALDKEITEIRAENEQILLARTELEESMDLVQNELKDYVDYDDDPAMAQIDEVFSAAFLGHLVDRGSIDKYADDARDRLLNKIYERQEQLEMELELEEEQARQVESEIHRYRKQMMQAAAASKREDEFISGEKPPQYIFLENRIALLRKNLRETVAAMARAGNEGDQAAADMLSIKRAGLKDDLKNALDEMQQMEVDLNMVFDVDQRMQQAAQNANRDSNRESDTRSSDLGVNVDLAPHQRASEVERLQARLAKLRSTLHDTVLQIAQPTTREDPTLMAELSARRLQLKDEIKVVQDEFQKLTNSSLAVSGRTEAMAMRQSMSVSGRSSMSMRPSMPIFSRPPSFDRRPYDRSTSDPPVLVRDVSRSSSTASSIPSYDSNPQPLISTGSTISTVKSTTTEDKTFPVMEGILMKHASVLNEKGSGVFGRMNFRGARERWCMIDPSGFLRYYKRKGDKEPRGTIPLGNPSLEILYGPTVGKDNEFMLCSSTHQTRFVAKNPTEMKNWIMNLEKARVLSMERAGVSSHDNEHKRQDSGLLNPGLTLQPAAAMRMR